MSLKQDAEDLQKSANGKPGIRQQIVLYADFEEMRNSEVLGRHEVEQFGCGLEVDDLVSDEDLRVAKFVPRLLGLHDPKNIQVVPEFHFLDNLGKNLLLSIFVFDHYRP